MNSKDSWVYEKIFDEYRKAWQYAEKVAEQYGPLSRSVHINQCSEYNFEKSNCAGETLQSWSFDGKLFEKVDIRSFERLPFEKSFEKSVNRVFFDVAYGRFHISSDGGLVVIEYFFGPKFGQGFVYRVSEGEFIDQNSGWKS
jgi:hypothetical protein